MKVELLDYYGGDLSVVNAARVSMGKQRENMNQADVKLIQYLIKNKHWSPFEHAGFTFRLRIPIFVARQIMRHRSHSFNEISGRYVEFKPNDFYVPKMFREQDESIKQGSKNTGIDDDYAARLAYINCCENAYKTYEELLKLGVCKEQARSVLPLGTYTELIVTMNLRSFIHFLQLRLDGHTQAETRFVAGEMLKLVRNTGMYEISLGIFSLPIYNTELPCYDGKVNT
jgi:thymidylate synthase (FAD)